MSIEKTSQKRSSRYGSFSDNAKITQELMDVIYKSPNGNFLKHEHYEAFHMIFHKMARIVCGDMMYEDNPHDIAGYAKLLEDWMINENNNNKQTIDEDKVSPNT